MAEEEVKRPWWAEDIRHAWKWLTVQLGTLLAVAPQLYDMLPSVQENFTTRQFHGLMTVVAILTVLANLRNKEPK